jgi:hypothetical protein
LVPRFSNGRFSNGRFSNGRFSDVLRKYKAYTIF